MVPRNIYYLHLLYTTRYTIISYPYYLYYYSWNIFTTVYNIYIPQAVHISIYAIWYTTVSILLLFCSIYCLAVTHPPPNRLPIGEKRWATLKREDRWPQNRVAIIALFMLVFSSQRYGCSSDDFKVEHFSSVLFFFSEGSLSLGRIFPKNTLLGIGKNFLNLQVTLLRTQSP